MYKVRMKNKVFKRLRKMPVTEQKK